LIITISKSPKTSGSVGTQKSKSKPDISRLSGIDKGERKTISKKIFSGEKRNIAVRIRKIGKTLNINTFLVEKKALTSIKIVLIMISE
jgi:hypothetical protein